MEWTKFIPFYLSFKLSSGSSFVRPKIILTAKAATFQMLAFLLRAPCLKGSCIPIAFAPVEKFAPTMAIEFNHSFYNPARIFFRCLFLCAGIFKLF